MQLVIGIRQMSNADDILKIANQIKVEILSKYDTSEIAEQYAKALVNASNNMSNIDDILKIANKIKNEILIKHDTSEFALRYAKVINKAIAKI